MADKIAIYSKMSTIDTRIAQLRQEIESVLFTNGGSYGDTEVFERQVLLWSLIEQRESLVKKLKGI